MDFPTKNKKRAVRRHHMERLKERQMKRGKTNLAVYDESYLKRWALRTWQHPQKCSCQMCGNPRRYKIKTGKTLRERYYDDERFYEDE